jgi:CHAT domain-containing protein/Tfp pilus assembly protein PilF
MTRKLACVCATLATAGPAVGIRFTPPLAAHRQEVTVLEAKAVVERRLGRGEEHRYELPLKAGECATVIVEQRGVDVVVHTRDADARVIADFQDEIGGGGRQEVGLVADSDGTYGVVLDAARGTVAPGHYAIRIESRRAATDADRAVQEARRLRTAAAQLNANGRFDDARRLLARALTVTETVRGPDDPRAAIVAAELAGVYRSLADSARSESLYRRALAIMDQTPGAWHPRTALTRCQLASLYQHAGDSPRAEPLLKQGLNAIEKTLSQDHPWFVSCLTTLGNVRDDAGDIEEEAAIVRRALAISEKIHDTNSKEYAELLNNLAEVYRQQQNYTDAEQLLQRSLALSENLFGPDNYSVATALQNLGIVARERKDYATAVAYNTRALSIRLRIVGPDHPDVAHILTNLASIYRATGDYPRSLEMHLRALRIWEKAVGPYQHATLMSVGNIAKTYAASGDLVNAVAYQRRCDAILEKQLALNLAVGSERQKLVFLRWMAERTDRTISLHLRQAPGSAEAGSLAALVLLQRKGRALDAMIDAFAAVRRRIANVGDQRLLEQLNTTTAELARVALSSAPAASALERQAAIIGLDAKKDRLEAELSEHSAEFRAEMLPVTLATVQAAIPETAALLEFAVFRPFDPRAERNAEAYGAPHYAAYVVRRHGTPRGIDLGDAKTIDARVAAFREVVRDAAHPDPKPVARALDALVMQPLGSLLDGATRLLISPDGELNLVPFDALVDEQSRYLIERYAISYLTSGRDLLRVLTTRASASRGKPIIFADPLFGEPASPALGESAGTIQSLSSPRSRRQGAAAVAADAATGYFAPLAATAEEGRAIKALFPSATLLTGALATKAALQRVDAPPILHIASHGFFLDDATRGGSGSTGTLAGARAMSERLDVHNPLLRSGLALAGANLPHDIHQNGILTALEASGLNLRGTKLVTLSACDTGIGEVRTGEGVYGLRRAFVLAGTETLVMSLWPISDYIARETMVAYYTGLRDGLGRGDALRQAKLAMLKRNVRQHPFYWASFIQSGEWASLDGTR